MMAQISTISPDTPEQPKCPFPNTAKTPVSYKVASSRPCVTQTLASKSGRSSISQCTLAMSMVRSSITSHRLKMLTIAGELQWADKGCFTNDAENTELVGEERDKHVLKAE